MQRANLDNQPTKTEPARRLKSRCNRSPVEQHKCNAVNRDCLTDRRAIRSVPAASEKSSIDEPASMKLKHPEISQMTQHLKDGPDRHPPFRFAPFVFLFEVGFIIPVDFGPFNEHAIGNTSNETSICRSATQSLQQR